MVVLTDSLKELAMKNSAAQQASDAARKIRARANSPVTLTQHGAAFVEGLRCAANIADALAARELTAAQGVIPASLLAWERDYQDQHLPNYRREDVKRILADWRESLSQPTEPQGAVVGPMDLSAPPKVWLQIDTNGDPDDRRETIPEAHWGDLTWCYESIGGQEVVYIRQDLAALPVAVGAGEVRE